MKNGGDDYVYCDDKKEITGSAPTCEEDKCAAVKVENGVVSTQGSGAWIWVKVRILQNKYHILMIKSYWYWFSRQDFVMLICSMKIRFSRV